LGVSHSSGIVRAHNHLGCCQYTCRQNRVTSLLTSSRLKPYIIQDLGPKGVVSVPRCLDIWESNISTTADLLERETVLSDMGVVLFPDNCHVAGV
jgi:hypothetical protein